MKTHTKLADTAEVATWLSGCVALLLHYSGSNSLSPETLGAMITAALLPLAMGVVRLVSRYLSSAKGDNPPPDETGFTSVALLPLIAALGVILMITLSGCGANYHLYKGGWKLDKAECGTRLTVYGDGDPEVSVICIKESAPLKVGPKVKAKLCGGS